jgi:methionyl-tRNA formyltransferase
MAIMFQTLLLLTGDLELPYLSSMMARHHPDLDIIGIETRQALSTLAPYVLAGARLVAFATPVIVPPSILDALGHGAYNFHPGPPEYRGWYPHCFASYEQAATFGATAHVMTKHVDAGPIVALERFAVSPGGDAAALGERAYGSMLKLFAELAPALVGPDLLPLVSASWSERFTTRRDFASMCRLSQDMPAEEIQRRIGAFGAGDGFSRPHLELHGHRFMLADEEPDTPALTVRAG